MFSSLASFIFGSNTSESTNSEATLHTAGPRREQEQQLNDNNNTSVRIDAENTINLTSSTPSVSGSISETNAGRHQGQGGKRSKGKRNKNNRNKKTGCTGQWIKTTPTITKLLTPNESCDEDLEEDDWFIVEKEDEEDSLPRTDSEEELSVVEVKPLTITTSTSSATPVLDTSASGSQALRYQQQQQQQQQQRQRQHINSHSLYSGPRPQQQRNFLQRQQRNSGARIGAALSVSTLSPPRNITVAGINTGNGVSLSSTLANVENVTQSLYVSTSPASPSSPSSPAPTSSSNSSYCGSEFGANNNMEESWFITPPPCFTSIGPINMETSPYENLLIEHPSMSVYHSIRSAQEAAESFVNLDLGVGESRQQNHEAVVAAVSATSTDPEETANAMNIQAVQQQSQARMPSARSAQLKQELFARSSQKSYDMKERQYLCRGAIQRSNKVRDFQSRGNRQRRSDMQHCKLISGANNNRKCCF